MEEEVEEGWVEETFPMPSVRITEERVERGILEFLPLRDKWDDSRSEISFEILSLEAEAFLTWCWRCLSREEVKLLEDDLGLCISCIAELKEE